MIDGSTRIEVGQVYQNEDGSASEVLEILRGEIRFRQIGESQDGYGDDGEVYTFSRPAFLSSHTGLTSPATPAAPAESPILAMVPAAARASVVRVDWLDKHGNLCRVECTGPAEAAPEAAPRTVPGGLTSDQIATIVDRARRTLSEHMPTGRPGNDWDKGWDSGIEKVLRLLSEAVGEDL